MNRDSSELRSTRAVPFLVLSGAAATSFILLARAVARRKTAPLDHTVHEHIAVPEGETIRETAEAGGPVGKWRVYVPAAALAAAGVLASKPRSRQSSSSSRRYGAAAILATALSAAALNQVFDDLVPQPPPPPGRPPDHPVFPSGHAFGTAAVAMAIAYVLLREELVPTAVVLPLAALLPAATSAARMIEEKHWLSDIVGGHLAAIALAGISLGAYEHFSASATTITPESAERD